MSKKLAIIIMFIALGGGAIAYTANQNNNDSSNVTSTSSTSFAETPTNEAEAETVAGSGSYVEYSETALASAEGQKVLFFHAPWCSQCRSIEQGIKSQGVPEGFTIIKVDYDSNQDLRAKYGVKLQTTFVKLDDNNDKIDDFVAYSEPTFEAVKRDYL